MQFDRCEGLPRVFDCVLPFPGCATQIGVSCDPAPYRLAGRRFVALKMLKFHAGRGGQFRIIHGATNLEISPVAVTAAPFADDLSHWPSQDSAALA